MRVKAAMKKRAMTSAAPSSPRVRDLRTSGPALEDGESFRFAALSRGDGQLLEAAVSVLTGGKRGWVGTCAPACWDDDDARGCARRVVPVRVPGELAILEAFGGAASGGVSGCVLAMHPRRHDCDSEAANQHDDRDTDNRDRDE